MSTTTTPQPSAPTTLSPERPTAPLEPSAADAVLDALPLLDHRTRRRTIAVALAPRGHYLALKDGDETRLLRLERNIIHVGRGAGIDVRFDEHRVSRSHAILVRHGRHFRLLDNRSSNGTFLNGRRVVATNIDNGDAILIGPVAMQYVAVG